MTGATAASSAANDQAWLEPAFVEAVARLPGVDRVLPARTRAIVYAPGQPHVTLIARDLREPSSALALQGAALPPREGERSAYVSEAMTMIHGAQVGTMLAMPLRAKRAGRSIARGSTGARARNICAADSRSVRFGRP